MTVLAEDANARRHNKEARVREQGVQTDCTGVESTVVACDGPRDDDGDEDDDDDSDDNSLVVILGVVVGVLLRVVVVQHF